MIKLLSKITIVLVIVLLSRLEAQTIVKGQLSHHKGQAVTLTGFNYLESYTLAKDTITSTGHYTLLYDKDYKGMAVLQTQDNTTFVLSLTEPNITINGTHLTAQDSLQFVNSPKNTTFFSIGKAYGWRSQVYDAWRYLEARYKLPQAKDKALVLKEISNEIKQLDAAHAINLKQVQDPYLKWFLPLKKETNDMPKSIRRYTERIPQHIETFRTTDFTNPYFKTSGLFKEYIEAHYFMLENMGKPLNSIYTEMNKSTNHILTSLKDKPEVLNALGDHLFRYFEKRSLFPAAAHLSEQLLSNSSCELDKKLSNTMEKYGTLKKGNTAPNITLKDKDLRDYEQPVLLVFGASWCGYCKDDLEKLKSYYHDWKTKKNLEVVYISLDTDFNAYNNTYGEMPWELFCDFKGWETKAAKAYFVNATPTYILIDKNQVILEHPRSLEQVNSWVEYRL